jgi:protein gp37
MHDVPDTPTEPVANQAVTILLRQSATASRPVRKDLFHRSVPDEYIAEVFAVMAAAHWHTFQILTKRHARMHALLSDPDFRSMVCMESATLGHEGFDVTVNNPWETWPSPNIWLGVSVENQHWADIRIPVLVQTPAAVRFISAEPLLGPIDVILSACPGVFIDRYLGQFSAIQHTDGCCQHALNLLDWVIVGGESGPGARPMHPDWARDLRDQCHQARIPFFFKQWGNYAPYTNIPPTPTGRHGPTVLVTPTGTLQAPHREPIAPAGSVLMCRCGKQNAGRILDGRTWDQYPRLITSGGHQQ